jgi:hypothetical protein
MSCFCTTLLLTVRRSSGLEDRPLWEVPEAPGQRAGELAALGVAFISLRDNLDLSTPSGRLMFQIIGAMAEFERALIQERDRAGLRNARAKGRRLGRPRVVVDASRIASLRASGRSWSPIEAELGVSKGTASGPLQPCPKSDREGFWAFFHSARLRWYPALRPHCTMAGSF